MQETWVRSLIWEDLLEKEMAIPSNILSWKIPWTEEPGRLQSKGLQRVGYDCDFFFFKQLWKQCQILFFWTPKSLQMVIAAMKLKDAYSLEGKL